MLVQTCLSLGDGVRVYLLFQTGICQTLLVRLSCKLQPLVESQRACFKTQLKQKYSRSLRALRESWGSHHACLHSQSCLLRRDSWHAGLPPDPRHTQLGARGPVRLANIEEDIPPYSGAMLGVIAADETAYRLQRYQLGIAEGPEEVPSGVSSLFCTIELH
jgi:hypothetical protein